MPQTFLSDNKSRSPNIRLKRKSKKFSSKSSRTEAPSQSLLSQRIYSVSEITRRIKNLLESSKDLNDILLRGEISMPKAFPSGHTYFTLKDEDSQIKCIIYRKNIANVQFNLEHGLKVIIKGSISVYEPRGDYSIVVDEVQPDGIGSLNLAFVQLKNKLESQGLFSPEYKKPLPEFPQTIGLVTSSSGAVFHDIMNVLKRRYPLVKVLFVPTPVQGKEASNAIIDGIEILNHHNVDVIILARGGGSLEDLWSFNEESVARAIFASRIPIISAVGHETDFTIADFVADYRAPTPSAAAERAVPDIKEIVKLMFNWHTRIQNATLHHIQSNIALLDQLANRPIFRKPLEAIYAYHQKLDALDYQIISKTQQSLHQKRKSLEILDSKLTALNPTAILERGYSIVLKDNKAIKDANEVSVDTNINIILHKGELEARVKRIK